MVKILPVLSNWNFVGLLTAGWGGGSRPPGQTGSEADQADRQTGQVPGSAHRGALQTRPLPLLSHRGLLGGGDGEGVGVLVGGNTRRVSVSLDTGRCFWILEFQMSALKWWLLFSSSFLRAAAAVWSIFQNTWIAPLEAEIWSQPPHPPKKATLWNLWIDSTSQSNIQPLFQLSSRLFLPDYPLHFALTRAVSAALGSLSSLQSVLLKHQVLLWLKRIPLVICHSLFPFQWNPVTLNAFSIWALPRLIEVKGPGTGSSSVSWWIEPKMYSEYSCLTPVYERYFFVSTSLRTVLQLCQKTLMRRGWVHLLLLIILKNEKRWALLPKHIMFLPDLLKKWGLNLLNLLM